MSRSRYEGLARSIARDWGIPEGLFLALITQESGWNPTIGSSAGAVGLTQLMPGTARSLGVTDRTNPAQSLRGGAKYLADQKDRFGTWALALAAYNAGPGNVERYGGIPPFRETQNYVRTVMANAGDLSGPTGAGAPPRLPADTSRRPWAGTQRPIGELTELAKVHIGPGFSFSGKRPGRDTASGNVSDHFSGNRTAYAHDLNWGSSTPTDKSDAAASAIVFALSGGAVKDWGKTGGNYRRTVNGVRYQVIYRSNEGGNHFNHIHVGAKRVGPGNGGTFGAGWEETGDDTSIDFADADRQGEGGNPGEACPPLKIAIPGAPDIQLPNVACQVIEFVKEKAIIAFAFLAIGVIGVWLVGQGASKAFGTPAPMEVASVAAGAARTAAGAAR